MSNLEQKFTGFEQQTAAQHNALMAKIDLTNSKLDALLNALGAPPPGQSTLDDVVARLDTLITATNAVNDTCGELADIHLDTISIDQKLLRIRDAMAPLGENLPAGEKVSMAWALYRLMDATAPDWPRLPDQEPIQKKLYLLANYLETQLPVLERLESIYDTLGIYGTHANLHINEAIELLLNNIGYPTGDATSTLLGLLACICNTSMGAQPPSASSGACGPSQFASATTALHNDKTWAVWSSTTLSANNLEFGTTFQNLGQTGKEIRPISGDWTGWKMFAYSKASAFYSDRPDLAEFQLPTNVWRNLAGEINSKAFFTRDPNADLAIYLCPPGAIPPPEIDPDDPPDPVQGTLVWSATIAATGTTRVNLAPGLYKFIVDNSGPGYNITATIGNSEYTGANIATFGSKSPTYYLFAVPKYYSNATNVALQGYVDVNCTFLGSGSVNAKIYAMDNTNAYENLTQLRIRAPIDKTIPHQYRATFATTTDIEMLYGWTFPRNTTVNPPVATPISSANLMKATFTNLSTAITYEVNLGSNANRTKTIPAGTYKIVVESPTSNVAFFDIKNAGA